MELEMKQFKDVSDFSEAGKLRLFPDHMRMIRHFVKTLSGKTNLQIAQANKAARKAKKAKGE
jgi:hypothetical protein